MKKDVIKKILEKLENANYIDPAEHVYDAIKTIKRKLDSNITIPDIEDFLWGLSSSTNIDVDGTLAECVDMLKSEFNLDYNQFDI